MGEMFESLFVRRISSRNDVRIVSLCHRIIQISVQF